MPPGLKLALLALFLLRPPAWAQGEELLVRVLLREVPLGQEVRLLLPEGELRAWGVREGVVVGGRLGPFWEFASPRFALEGRPYRGGVRLLLHEGRLLVVNVLPLEAYLLGVLPGEMPGSFPLEALLAQAVVARTFAVYRLNPRAPYDLCAGELCQVYLGLAAETPRHGQAVAATQGQVLSYGGEAISALYHADSGGMTAGSEEVFQRALPYLRPRPDPYARGPRSQWRLALTPEAAAQALRGLGYTPQGQEPPVVRERSPSGRVWRLRVLGVEVQGPEAQRLARLMGLPSALVEFQGWEAVGRGAGHGVGLSQWGARGMAEAGYGYREILGHYFPGTFLSDLLLGQARGAWAWSGPP
ncbi:SpoIID/LytB domain-containing protein [Thermus thermamylovorans]|uniref:SpoIID/LytB domain-containing protein n=1 Tax=Thermus thermamylovorans TaxID=2509362 RepID=A0A4Q9B4K2_9DEIN|nr:SpoIID/LytB domain-containing protein [Thermus thermamylovorans]TBH20868.1 SpoIID/LytB domain-containing protein [Thermus thermamylovorans]